jgi:fatty acid desaturase
MITSKRYPVAALWAVVTLSSLTMLGLFWRFPVPACIGSIALLATLLHCAHFARLIDLGASAEKRGGPDLGRLDHQA